MCQPLSPPPANVNNVPPPVDDVTSTRERFAQHVADPGCAGCHKFIDPIGLGFEHYDAIGKCYGRPRRGERGGRDHERARDEQHRNRKPDSGPLSGLA
ncbi:hypothetical protein BE20_41830 [Sorangium cellulosum]|nr:hypothetical protein BE20_41830 [Sorangium cellulosum]